MKGRRFDESDEDRVLAALLRFQVSRLGSDLAEVASLVCGVAEFNRDLFASFAIELLASVCEGSALQDSPDVEKVAALLEFLAPYQEALRVLGCIRQLQGRREEAAELQSRALTSHELIAPGVTMRLAKTMHQHRARVP